MRAEEGDESIDDLADEAAKAKKELRESRKGAPASGTSCHRRVARHTKVPHVRHLS